MAHRVGGTKKQIDPRSMGGLRPLQWNETDLERLEAVVAVVAADGSSAEVGSGANFSYMSCMDSESY